MRTGTNQSFAWLEGQYPELAAWLRDTSTYLSAEAVCEVKDYDGRAGITLFTEHNEYHIAAEKGGRSYLGLTFCRRDTGAGNDLADGPYEKSTWERIIRDMLSCELISLKRRDNPAHND